MTPPALPSPEPLRAESIPAPVVEAVVRHARACLPDEACGLIAVDRVGRVRMAYPLTNTAASATGFTIAPREHFGALRHAERRGWEIGGVFHSHPGGTATLSAVDLAQPHDPDWFHLVVGFSPDLQVRTWWIRRPAHTAASHPMAPRSAR